MTTVPTKDAVWRKSSRSSGQDTCVEVRGDLAAVRDTKNRGPVLMASIADVVTAAKAGLFDR